jgi:hypothetical protein
MILSILRWFKLIGFFLWDNKKVVLPIIGILILTIWFTRACNRPPKLDEKAIQRAQQAIAENDREKMKEVLAESEVREQNIDANLAMADRQKVEALANARKKAEQMSNEELAAELERRMHE